MSAILEPATAPASDEPIDTALADALERWLGCREPWLRASLAALSQALRDGHACLDLAAWAGTTWQGHAEAEPVELPALADWQARLSGLGIGPGAEQPVVLDGHRLYLRRYWRFETELAAALRARLADSPPVDVERARAVLERLFPEPAEEGAADRQKVAAANALLQRVSVIAGGPGTGKTHTVTRLLALIASAGGPGGEGGMPRIRLAAPTGKAAQRLAESVARARGGLDGVVPEDVLEAIPETAATLHRLLGVRGDGTGFRHHEAHRLDLDVLVVDETSMVDLPLMARLFRALPETCRVVLLGDADQLPSVAAGSVLADLVTQPHPGYSPQRRAELASLGVRLPEAGRDSLAAADAARAADHQGLLEQSRRFAGEGGIGRLAGAVIEGAADRATEILARGDAELAWLPPDALDAALDRWIRAHYAPVAEAADLATAFARLAGFRILCPTRGGPVGVRAMNERVLAALNPRRRRFFPGQPIMVTHNHYGLGLYNGDVGLLWPDDDGQLLAWFPEGEGYRPLAPGRLPPHETVYAMTIHKTQGSELDRVALILPEQVTPILSRELLYTGMTRAREGLEVVGGEAVWRAGVARRVERRSGLAERLFW